MIRLSPARVGRMIAGLTPLLALLILALTGC